MKRFMTLFILSSFACVAGASAQGTRKSTRTEAIEISRSLLLDEDVAFVYGEVGVFRATREYWFADSNKRTSIYAHAEITLCGPVQREWRDCTRHIYIPLSQNNPRYLRLFARVDSSVEATRVRITKTSQRVEILFVFATERGLKVWQTVLGKAGLTLQPVRGVNRDAEIKFEKIKYPKSGQLVLDSTNP